MKAIGWLVFIARWERDDFTLLPTHLSVKRLTVIKKKWGSTLRGLRLSAFWIVLHSETLIRQDYRDKSLDILQEKLRFLKALEKEQDFMVEKWVYYRPVADCW